VHFGLEFSFVDTSFSGLRAHGVAPNTKMIYIETPANPTLSVTDIGQSPNWRMNETSRWWLTTTFLSPYLQRPSNSARNRGSFHDEVFERPQRFHGGAVVLTRPEDAEKIYFIQRSAGTGLAPMDCFLVSRGIKTLAVRMLQHNANGITVARHLDAHPKVKKSLLPRPASHRSTKWLAASRKARARMLSFDVGSLDAARRFLNTSSSARSPKASAARNLISFPR